MTEINKEDFEARIKEAMRLMDKMTALINEIFEEQPEVEKRAA